MAQPVPDYSDWFGFKEPPFRLSPDLDFFYPAKPHREVLEVLKYAIARGEGFMVLSGHAGTGKTMLLRLLMNELKHEKKTAFIVTPSVSPKGLLLLLLEELDISIANEDSELALLLKTFQDALLTLASKKEKLLIIIDEAQDLPIETIEQLRLLSNIETNKEKLLQILLVGQPELQNLLADPRLCQLTQRIVINEVLRPLTQDETRDYIHFRLSKAGRGDLQLSNSFISKLYNASHGLPRLINRLMDRALLMAAASGYTILLPKHLDSALTTLPEPKGFYDANISHNNTFWKHCKKYMNACLVTIGIIAILILLGIQFELIRIPVKEHPCPQTALNSDNKDHFLVAVKPKQAKIYSNPLKNSKILSIVKKGERLLVLDQTDRWFFVKAENIKGQKITGWIFKKSVKRIRREDLALWKKTLDFKPQ